MLQWDKNQLTLTARALTARQPDPDRNFVFKSQQSVRV